MIHSCAILLAAATLAAAPAPRDRPAASAAGAPMLVLAATARAAQSPAGTAPSKGSRVEGDLLGPGEALYREGIRLLEEGTIDEALARLDGSIAASPRGPFADRALLAAAAAEYPPGTVDQIGGRLEPGRIESARRRLDRIVRDPGASGSAPRAALQLGLLLMDPSNPSPDLGGAVAALSQAIRLAPRSAEAAAALDAASECHRLQGNLAASASADAALVLEHSSSPFATRARLRLAESAAILGETGYARALLAPLSGSAHARRGAAPPRAGGVADDSGETLEQEARSREALIVRAEADRANPPGARAFDGSLPTGAGGAIEAIALAAAPDGTLVVLDRVSGQILTIGADGGGASMVAGPEAPGARGLVLDHAGRVVLWDEKAVVLPGGNRVEPRAPKSDKPGEHAEEDEPVRRIGGLAAGPFGEIDLIDHPGNRILRYGPDLTFRRVVARLEARVTALARWHGTIYALVPSRREVVVLPPDPSAAPSSIALGVPEWEISSPEAIAVDALGRIYVLDASSRTVTVLDREGKRVARLAPPRGAVWEMRSPTALAVDAAGRIFVADKRFGRVLRFR